jgi:DNA-binding Xre family transcriptional regulator
VAPLFNRFGCGLFFLATNVTLSRIANHRDYNPKADILDRLCTYFGCRLDQLVEHTPDLPAEQKRAEF